MAEKKRGTPDLRKIGEFASAKQKARDKGARRVRNDQARIESLIEEFSGFSMRELDLLRQGRAMERRERESKPKPKKQKTRGTKFKRELGA